ncbi:flagellar export protein FliJ [Buttiauxella warmboldiae]|uniref:Flagellar FliJ protein n=1 Tax=Buttiauxella warmboldiae TaxID=82993 RepID=A0A3N5DDG9_9ENTR|nr:flagellar export protein FliJ [Buttiauxella warmboldiae]RPH26525.1 flagellar export protein FliJ [Buttiauxella warmboldiae]
MAVTKPMDFLRERAERTLTDTTARLGEAQQAHTLAAKQLGQLEQFELEYQQQLRATVSGKGIPVAELLNRQSFIDSLGNVVKQQAGHVAKCRDRVDETLLTWRGDKKRLNAFETLQSRANRVQEIKENKLEQKLMDEFAQRACMGRKIL